MRLDFLAGEECVAGAPAASALERAPFDADRYALPRTAIAVLTVGAVEPDDVVELLPPEAEFVPRSCRRREQRALTGPDDTRCLVGHGDAQCTHTARDVGYRRGDSGVHLVGAGEPEQSGADFIVAQRSGSQRFIDRGCIALEPQF